MRRDVVLAVAAVLAASLSAPANQAQKTKMSAQIVNRQSSETEYTYVVPGYATSNCNASVYGNTASGNCAASGVPARLGSYSVRGTTLSLLLSDGRIVVANCAPKVDLKPHMGNNWYRSCRAPLVNTIEAEFDGDNAKLEWSVSIDGKKKQGETYKIIAILVPDPTKPHAN